MFVCCESGGPATVVFECSYGAGNGGVCKGLNMYCFGSADCGSGDVCCLDRGGVYTASCYAGTTCPGSGANTALQLCHSDADCQNHDCVTYSCEGLPVNACSATRGLTGCTKAVPDAGHDTGAP
jgi:hypothetical protein